MKKIKYLFSILALGLFMYFPISQSKAEPFNLWLDYHTEKDEDGGQQVVCEGPGQKCLVILM